MRPWILRTNQLALAGLRTADAPFAERFVANQNLVKRLKKLRGAYIRLDEVGVTLMWAGDEKSYSAMIRDHGDYWKMINSFLDNLADIADLVEAPTE